MIDDYFRDIIGIPKASPIVKSQQVIFDKRDRDTGYVRGDVFLKEGALLHFREFVNTEFGIDRYTYVYHFQRADGALIFRYDNTGHFRNLPNFPHHKHVGDQAVVSAASPDLAAVLGEIESLLPV